LYITRYYTQNKAQKLKGESSTEKLLQEWYRYCN